MWCSCANRARKTPARQWGAIHRAMLTLRLTASNSVGILESTYALLLFFPGLMTFPPHQIPVTLLKRSLHTTNCVVLKCVSRVPSRAYHSILCNSLLFYTTIYFHSAVLRRPSLLEYLCTNDYIDTMVGERTHLLYFGSRVGRCSDAANAQY